MGLVGGKLTKYILVALLCAASLPACAQTCPSGTAGANPSNLANPSNPANPQTATCNGPSGSSKLFATPGAVIIYAREFPNGDTTKTPIYNCRAIQNNGPTTLFLPWNTPAEWTDFLKAAGAPGMPPPSSLNANINVTFGGTATNPNGCCVPQTVTLCSGTPNRKTLFIGNRNVGTDFNNGNPVTLDAQGLSNNPSGHIIASSTQPTAPPFYPPYYSSASENAAFGLLATNGVDASGKSSAGAWGVDIENGPVPTIDVSTAALPPNATDATGKPIYIDPATGDELNAEVVYACQANLVGNSDPVTGSLNGSGWVLRYADGSCTPVDGQCIGTNLTWSAPPSQLNSTTLCALNSGSKYAGDFTTQYASDGVTVTGWKWTCNGTGGLGCAADPGGICQNTSCTANYGTVTASLSCGSANNKWVNTYSQSNPPPSDMLCSGGVAATSGPTYQAIAPGTGPAGLYWWYWYCGTTWCGTQVWNGGGSGPAVCGPAINDPSNPSIRPTDTLCNVGTPSTVSWFSDSTSWGWTCFSTSSVFCTTPPTDVTASKAGQCGSNGACAYGTASALTGNCTTGTCTWACQGDSGTPATSCSAGSSSGGPTGGTSEKGTCGSLAPSSVAPNSNQCASGAPTSATGSITVGWSWKCMGTGSDAGQDSDCFAPPCTPCAGSASASGSASGGSGSCSTSISWSGSASYSQSATGKTLSWSDTFGGGSISVSESFAPSPYCQTCYIVPNSGGVSISEKAGSGCTGFSSGTSIPVTGSVH